MSCDVFLVASPLQALNALEAQRTFQTECPVAVLLESLFELSNRQVREILEEAGWRDFRPIHIEKGRFRKRYTNLPEVMDGLRSLPVNRLFLGFYGDIFLHAAQRVPHRELYLLDDGVATISLNHARMNGGFDGTPTPFLKRVARRALLRVFDGIRVKPIDTLRYFSIYQNLQSNERNIIHPQSMERLRSTFQNASLQRPGASPASGGPEACDAPDRERASRVAAQNGELWFLGLGSEQIFKTEDLYLEALQSALRGTASGTIRYIPHRYESSRQVERIRRECHAEILVTNAPIELYLARAGTLPRAVASFVSSALYTIGVLFPNQIELTAYRMDFRRVRARYHRQFGVIYDYYGTCPFIDVVDLPTAAAGPKEVTAHAV